MTWTFKWTLIHCHNMSCTGTKMTSLEIVKWKRTKTYSRYERLTQYIHISDWINNWLKIAINMANCTRIIQCPTWYETVLLRATSLDKINQFMKACLPSKADLTMHNIYLPNKLRWELCCGCTAMQIQHGCIDLGPSWLAAKLWAWPCTWCGDEII